MALGTILPGSVSYCQWEPYCQGSSLSVSGNHTAKGLLLLALGTILPGSSLGANENPTARGRLLVSLGTILPGIMSWCQWEPYRQGSSLGVTGNHSARGHLFASFGTILSTSARGRLLVSK